MDKILIRHLTGARGNEVDEFPASVVDELIAGRDPAAGVRFDLDRDDLVSRQHMKIMRDPSAPNGFQIVDLQSSNGTFLNGTRVFGAAPLNHDDIVQLGAGGPEFRFEIVPPPVVSGARPTREASLEMLTGLDSRRTRESWLPSPGGPRPAGRATVERMLGDVFTRVKRESTRSLWVGVMALIAILSVGSVIWLYLKKSQAEQAAVQVQNAATIQQVHEQVKQTPADLNAMKEQIAALERELKQSGQRSQAVEAENQELLRQLREKVDQANKAIATARVPIPPATQAPHQASTGGPSGATFESLMEQANDQYQRGHSREAFGLVNEAITKDDKRWEAYDLGARLAVALRDYSGAEAMLEKALQTAPVESRADIQFRIEAVRQQMTSK